MLAASSANAAPRVVSLDQCADQYVLALSPRDAIAGLSMRADDADSRLRAKAKGLPKRRVGLESTLAARPDVVVRYWGGDPRLLAALAARGVQVITIADATEFSDIRANIRRVASSLDQTLAGEALIGAMDIRLRRSAGAWRGVSAVYLTPGGITAGPGTMVDAILRAAGLRNATATRGFEAVSLERLALDPPRTVVLGFFDTFQLAGDSWGPGRHRLIRNLVAERAVARLPGSTLGCPDASAAEAVAILAAQAPR